MTRIEGRGERGWGLGGKGKKVGVNGDLVDATAHVPDTDAAIVRR